MFNLIEVSVPEDVPSDNESNKAKTSYFLLNQKTERVYMNIKGEEEFTNKFVS